MPVACKEQETAKRRIFHSTGTPSHAPATPAASMSQGSLSFVALGEPLSAATAHRYRSQKHCSVPMRPAPAEPLTRRARCLAVAVETARRIGVAAGPGCLRHQHLLSPARRHQPLRVRLGPPILPGQPHTVPQARPGPHARAPPTHVGSVQRNNEPLSFTTGANCKQGLMPSVSPIVASPRRRLI